MPPSAITEITLMTTSGHTFSVQALDTSADDALTGIIARMNNQRAFIANTVKGKVVINTWGIATAMAKDVLNSHEEI